ncbi:MAG: hypothetical protein HN553_03550 [Opitutae bacterium]|nr:hypothetical protein [Opitutae bacterium]
MNFGKIEFLLFVLLASISLLLGKETAWKKIRTEKGVSVYKADVQGRVAFRGIGKMTGKPEQLISIIENPNGWKNWIENFKSGKLIEQINPSHKIFYQAIRSPFPFSDRDVVYESKILRDQPKTIRVEMKSIPHPMAPSTIGVRINILFSRYQIEKVDDNTMFVTFETLSDPGGALPGFVVNWASASYPITLLEGLRNELKTIQKKVWKE